jgi:hypothetical protein
VVSPFTPCHRNHRYPRVDFAHACRNARPCSWENLERRWIDFHFGEIENLTADRFLTLLKNFFQRRIFGGGEGMSMSGLNGWIVCCFHGARGGALEGKRWQLPARCAL